MKKLKKKQIIIIACVTALILALAAISFKTENNFISNTVGTVFSPVQRLGAGGVRVTQGFVKNIVKSGKNAQENKKLQKEVSELKEQIRMLEGYQTENEKFRTLLDLRESRRDFDCVAANVIGKSIDDSHSIITIDKGSKDNVKKNSVVFVSEGLVGIVFETGLNYSKVRTIFDSKSCVSAICLRSGDMGVVEPTGFAAASEKIRMNYIDRSAKTVIGDVIETSGTGGLFPKGIMIGKITEIKEDSRNLSLIAVLESSVKINHLDVVMVSVK